MENKLFIPVSREGKELVTRGEAGFALELYQQNIRDFIGEEIPAHWHGELEMFVLDQGKVKLSLLDREYELQAGEGYFLNASVVHGLECLSEGPCDYRSMVFDVEIVSGAAGSVFDLAYVQPFLAGGAPLYLLGEGVDSDDVLDLLKMEFERAFEAASEKKVGYEFEVRHALSRIVLTISQQGNSGSRRVISAQELRLKEMLSWLEAHYDEEIQVNDLAAVAGISVRECQRYFSKFLKQSPVQYLMNFRLRTAAEFLVSTNWTMTEIGLACGFKSSSYFAKQFRQRTGLSPRAYRHKAEGK